MRLNSDLARTISQIAKRWIAEHSREIIWAWIFAILAGYAIAVYLEEPKPYTVYVVVDKDTNQETLASMFSGRDLKIGKFRDVPVQLQLETLSDTDKETARKKAEDLVNRSDTLLVIEHGRSQHVESALPVYLSARPQVPLITTVASDDDLLKQCTDSCYDNGWFSPQRKFPPLDGGLFVPLLQLSPTNHIEGRSAVQFATQYNKRRFLIVLGSDQRNQSYTDSMKKAYSDAIEEFKAEVVGIRQMDNLPTKDDLNSLKPDCVLYAGRVGEAQTLFNRLTRIQDPNRELLMIFSDSVVESRGLDRDLAAFEADNAASKLVRARVPVLFTYQTDAADYNAHQNAYVTDAFSIATELVSDLDQRGGDFLFWAKALLHLHNAEDARRNLVRIIAQNEALRTWYQSSSGAPFVFKGHTQYRGMFHVWRLRHGAADPGSEMDDVDNWHPPRTHESPVLAHN